MVTRRRRRRRKKRKKRRIRKKTSTSIVDPVVRAIMSTSPTRAAASTITVATNTVSQKRTASINRTQSTPAVVMNPIMGVATNNMPLITSTSQAVATSMGMHHHHSRAMDMHPTRTTQQAVSLMDITSRHLHRARTMVEGTKEGMGEDTVGGMREDTREDTTNTTKAMVGSTAADTAADTGAEDTSQPIRYSITLLGGLRCVIDAAIRGICG